MRSGCRHDALRSLAAQRGVTDHVIFAGFVPDDELPAAYAACDVFANAGIAELQSLVTVEAMASSKPIVAADVRVPSSVTKNWTTIGPRSDRQ